MNRKIALQLQLLFVAVIGASWVQAQEPPVVPTVVPGGLVIWSGEQVSSCGIGDRTWTPNDHATCYFPIDLFAAAGQLSVWRLAATGKETRQIRVAAYPYETQILKLADDSKVNLSAADATRVQRENADIRNLWPRETTTMTPALPLLPPLDPLPPGGRFGARRIFNNQPRNPHTGVDYAAAKGTPVRAVADGIVALTGDHFFAGNSVFLDHGDGLITMFFHLDSVVVKPGDIVARGQTIATVGASGRATGPHLHFGVRWRGQRIDPEWLLRSSDTWPSIP